MTARKLPAVNDRVETGPVQFGDDWPGVFIRGDCAFGYVMALETVLAGYDDPISEAMVKGLVDLLKRSNISPIFNNQATMNAHKDYATDAGNCAPGCPACAKDDKQ